MTPEEFWFECLADEQYTRIAKGQPPLAADQETWKQDSQKKLLEIVQREQEEAKAKMKTTVEKQEIVVDPEEVFADA